MMIEEIKDLLGITNDRIKYLIKRNKLNNERRVV